MTTRILTSSRNHTHTIGKSAVRAGRGGGRSGSGGRGSGSRQRQQNKIYDITIRYNPNTAENSSGGNVLQKACNEIFTKTGHRGIFYPTTDITPAPAPITDISKHFPQTESSCQDFFRIKSNAKATQVTFFLSIEMAGSDVQLHKNTQNYFRTNNLWMDNEQIQKTRKEYAGFVLHANPGLVSHHNLANKSIKFLRKLPQRQKLWQSSTTNSTAII